MYERQQQTALEKVRQMFQQSKYPLQRQYNSARARYDSVTYNEQEYDAPARKTSGVDKAFPLKPVYHTRAYSLSNIYSSNKEMETMEPFEAQRPTHKFPTPSLDYPDRYDGRVGRRCPGRQLPEEQAPVPSSYGEASTKARGSQWVEGRLEEDQLRLAEKIRRKEIVLQEKLRRVVEELGRIQREKYTSMGPMERMERREPERNGCSKGRGLPREVSPRSPVHMADETSRRLQAEMSPERSSEEPFHLLPCRLCHRNFAADRLEKHRKVCEKVQRSTRKVFDSSKYRAKGTDLEEYLKTNSRRKTPELKKTNWRQKHEAFIRSLRQARMPAKVALQPQPCMDDDDDYQTCPHCARRFAPGPAERHIPKCQNIRSRPPPPRRRFK
ncbi:zinc finger C2HC domain-containing protein 1C [Megalops cyprinoides]|uniref:zinc finger C2HC domain-containing protein 1C n=1 Tax=Megalops cyprinoides TaxID=118141 RepID=UPI0018654C53|nr:zinc finger C2HC domain-containing protein 1C [Megalops cyprinoides]